MIYAICGKLVLRNLGFAITIILLLEAARSHIVR